MPARRLALVLVLVAACSRTSAPDPSTPEPARGVAEPAPSGERSFAYGDQTILVHADPALDGEVERLFEVFAALRAEAFVIGDASELPIGWTRLRFAVEGATIRVLEPDYDNDPEHAWRPDISVSLATLARQRAVLELVDVPGEAIDFDRHVLVVRGALAQPDVFLLRVASPGGRMTGWRLSPTAGMQPEDEVDSLPVHEILRARPELVDAMLLPAGYMAFFTGERLVTLVDEHDAVVWDWARDGELSGLGQVEASGEDEATPNLLPEL